MLDQLQDVPLADLDDICGGGWRDVTFAVMSLLTVFGGDAEGNRQAQPNLANPTTQTRVMDPPRPPPLPGGVRIRGGGGGGGGGGFGFGGPPLPGKHGVGGGVLGFRPNV